MEASCCSLRIPRGRKLGSASLLDNQLASLPASKLASLLDNQATQTIPLLCCRFLRSVPCPRGSRPAPDIPLCSLVHILCFWESSTQCRVEKLTGWPGARAQLGDSRCFARTHFRRMLITKPIFGHQMTSHPVIYFQGSQGAASIPLLTSDSEAPRPDRPPR